MKGREKKMMKRERLKKKRKKRNRSLSSVRVSVKQLAGDSTPLQYCVGQLDDIRELDK